MNVKIGDSVKWSNGRKPLGVVIHKFFHDDQSYVVVKKVDEFRGGFSLQVCKTERLIVVQ